MLFRSGEMCLPGILDTVGREEPCSATQRFENVRGGFSCAVSGKGGGATKRGWVWGEEEGGAGRKGVWGFVVDGGVDV